MHTYTCAQMRTHTYMLGGNVQCVAYCGLRKKCVKGTAAEKAATDSHEELEGAYPPRGVAITQLQVVLA